MGLPCHKSAYPRVTLATQKHIVSLKSVPQAKSSAQQQGVSHTYETKPTSSKILSLPSFRDVKVQSVQSSSFRNFPHLELDLRFSSSLWPNLKPYLMFRFSQVQFKFTEVQTMDWTQTISRISFSHFIGPRRNSMTIGIIFMSDYTIVPIISLICSFTVI